MFLHDAHRQGRRARLRQDGRMRITWGQALAWRLQRQFLAEPSTGDAVDVVHRLCGVQAQVPVTARLAVAIRLESATGTAGTTGTTGAMGQDDGAGPDDDTGRDVAAALAGRRLLRTWAMRGTLHLLTADTAADHLALLAAARTWEKGSWQRAFADAATMARLAELVPQALDGEPLTREELVAAVAGEAHDAALAEQLRSGWSTLLKPLSWQGLLCQGPGRGNRVTFTRPDRWVPDWRGLPEPDAAAATVLRGYLAAYGPATPEGFDQWLLRGASRRADLRRWFAELGDDAVRVDVDGRQAYVLTEHADELAATRPTSVAHLLPAFDQWVLGPGTTDTAVVPAEHRADVSRAGGWIAPVLLVGGRVAGTWEQDGGSIRVTPFPQAPAATPRLLAAQRRRLERLLASD